MEKEKVVRVHKDEKNIQQIKSHYLRFYKNINNPNFQKILKKEMFYLQLVLRNKMYLKKVSKKDMITILSNIIEYHDFINTWVKIYDSIPNTVNFLNKTNIYVTAFNLYFTKK